MISLLHTANTVDWGSTSVKVYPLEGIAAYSIAVIFLCDPCLVGKITLKG
jgi:hypothetical protein